MLLPIPEINALSEENRMNRGECFVFDIVSGFGVRTELAFRAVIKT